MGLKCNSVFKELFSFHVCVPGLSPCLGHDVLEGVLQYDMISYIKYFEANGWFTELIQKVLCAIFVVGSRSIF